jgi:crotonobetainyl-CoA:carnitine CoA-transferase CaiB-like acyl-CoA transferase
VTITGADPVTPSVHRLGDACVVALAAMGTEVAALWRERSGRGQDVRAAVDEAVAQLMAVLVATVSGVSTFTQGEANLVRNTDFYRTADGRSIDICAAYPRLRDVVCEVLDCAPLHDRIAAAVATWDGFALEDAIAARRGTATVVRTAAEWAEHPAGRVLAQRPLLRVERIGDSAPEPFPRLPRVGALPLSGLRVLDNGHVVAGPMAARMMAENGAEVLHLSHPLWPEHHAIHCETDIGKRSTYCDLADPAQAATFRALLRDADVYVSSWRSLDRKGFGAPDLAAIRPGIVVLDVQRVRP